MENEEDLKVIKIKLNEIQSEISIFRKRNEKIKEC